MRPIRVLVAARAETQIRAIEEWWKANRPDAPTLFVGELQAALERIAATPGVGAEYLVSGLRDVRRVLLRRSRYHVYYTVDTAREIAVVRAVWHGARGREPHLA